MKNLSVVLIVAAAAVVGIILWRRVQPGAAPAGLAPSAAGAPPPPLQPTLQGALANAFTTLLQQGTNYVSQWFTSQVSGVSQGQITAQKPQPVNSKGPNVAAPLSSTPNVVGSPTYFA